MLLKADDKPLSKPEDLLQIVKKTADNRELKLQLIRRAKKQTVSVKPAKRPTNELRLDLCPKFRVGGSIIFMPKTEEFHKLEFRVLRSGIICAKDDALVVELAKEPDKGDDQLKAIKAQLEKISAQLNVLQQNVKQLESQKQQQR